MKDIFGTKNEILLGINPCIYGLNYHDPSVVVFINGEVVFGIEEERCNRIKGSKGMFPSSAIKQSLIHCNLTWDDIDAIVQLLPKINKVEPNEGETQNIYIDTVLDKIEVLNVPTIIAVNIFLIFIYASFSFLLQCRHNV